MPRTALESISRLPEHARDEVSRAVADGRTWRHIAKICEGHGLKGVQAQNVTNYRGSKTYKQWQARQDRIAAIRGEQAESREIFDAALADGLNPAEAACLLASRKMLATINDLDLSVIHEAAVENPKLYIELIRAAVALSGSLKNGKASAPREDAAKAAPTGSGLSAEEQRQAIVDQVDKAMGIKR